MMWIWFYKTIDIPVGGFQNLRTKIDFLFLTVLIFPVSGNSELRQNFLGIPWI